VALFDRKLTRVIS